MSPASRLGRLNGSSHKVSLPRERRAHPLQGAQHSRDRQSLQPGYYANVLPSAGVYFIGTVLVGRSVRPESLIHLLLDCHQGESGGGSTTELSQDGLDEAEGGEIIAKSVQGWPLTLKFTALQPFSYLILLDKQGCRAIRCER
jgi:hypothetical protein